MCVDEDASSWGCPTVKNATKTAATKGEVSGLKRADDAQVPRRRAACDGLQVLKDRQHDVAPCQPGDTAQNVDERLVGDSEGRPCGPQAGHWRQVLGKRPTDGHYQDYGDADEKRGQDRDRPRSFDDTRDPRRGRVHELPGEPW